MPHRLVCPRCHRKGFIRTERVFNGAVSFTAFFCGICMHRWQERDRSSPPKREPGVRRSS